MHALLRIYNSIAHVVQGLLGACIGAAAAAPPAAAALAEDHDPDHAAEEMNDANDAEDEENEEAAAVGPRNAFFRPPCDDGLGGDNQYDERLRQCQPGLDGSKRKDRFERVSYPKAEWDALKEEEREILLPRLFDCLMQKSTNTGMTERAVSDTLLILQEGYRLLSPRLAAATPISCKALFTLLHDLEVSTLHGPN